MDLLEDCVPKEGARSEKQHYFGDFYCEIQLRSPERIRPFEPISGQLVISTGRVIRCAGIRVQLDAIVIVSVRKGSDTSGGPNVSSNGLFNNCCETFAGGYVQSPIRQQVRSVERFINFLGDVQYKPIIEIGIHRYPFNLSMTMSEAMPREFSTPNGFLKYKVAAYMESKTGVHVLICEKTVEFNGYYNLSTEPALQRIHLEKTFNKSMFSSKKFVTVIVNVDQSGFLPGEDIPFTLRIINPKDYPVSRISAKLLTRSTYNVYGLIATTLEVLDAPDIDLGSIEKEETLQLLSKFSIPATCYPTFQKSGKDMYSVVHLIEFEVDVEGYSLPLKCQAEIIVGTTRESDHEIAKRGDSESRKMLEPSNSTDSVVSE